MREKKNKILIVSPLGYTGLAYYDYSLCQSLTENGVDVELCTSDNWILDSHKNKFRLIPLYKRCSGDINKVKKGWNYVLSSIRILIHVLRHRVRIVHFQIVELPMIDLCLMILLKLFGKLIVFTPHDIIHNKRYPLSRVITSLQYRIADRIIVHKKVNVETIVNGFNINPGKIRIIPHGGYEYFVNSKITKTYARKTLGFNEDYKIVLFFGNIKPDKGVDILIKAMPIIRQKIDNVRLVIAGRLTGGLSEQWLIGELNKYSITDIVSTKPEFIPDDAVTLYYMASDIVVLPYTEISESGVLRYAQTCGRGVVCSDLQEFQDTVVHEKTGYLYRNRNYLDLAEQVTNAFLNNEYEEIGENARRVVAQDYCWSNISVLTRDLYGEISLYPD